MDGGLKVPMNIHRKPGFHGGVWGGVWLRVVIGEGSEGERGEQVS